MGVSNLDIEFEDEEEAKAREEAERKKHEVVEDVDLEFGASPEGSEDTDPGVSAPKTQNPEKEMSPAKKAMLAAKKKTKAREKAAKAETQAPQEDIQEQVIEQQPEAQEAPEPQNPNPSVSQTQAPVQQQVQEQAPPGGVLNVHQGQVPQNVQYVQMPQQQVYVGEDYKLGDELKRVAASNKVLAIEIEARIEVETTKRLTDIIAKHASDAKLLEHKVNRIITQIHQKAPALKKELMMIKKMLSEHAQIGEQEGGEEPAAAEKPNPKAKPKTAAKGKVPPKKKAA